MKLLQSVILLILFLNTSSIIAQKKTQEFGIVSDNDLYVSLTLDQYYTNGLELFYKKVRPTNYGEFTKKIKHIRLGQKIYNPFNADVPNIVDQDRPYAGYTYVRYSEQFINQQNILKIGVTGSYTGKKTGAKEAQNFIHQFYNIPTSDGWRSQVKEKVSIGIQANHVYNLFYKPEKKVQISLLNSFELSRIFTNISSGIAFKISTTNQKTTPISNTSFFGTALQTENENWIKESYFGIKSYTTYQARDLTITGELYNNFTQKEFHIKPWVWYNDIGYYWNLEKWNISYHKIIHTRKSKEISTKWITYGSIQVSYKF